MPPLFQLVSELSTLDTDELYRTLNMGVGMVVIVAPEHVKAVRESIPEDTWIIGELTNNHNKVLLK
jgi:phosphoribosylaminoimidazole (AIR) synthetase